MICFFCGERPATKEDQPFKLCDRCYKEREEVQEKLKKPLINESRKDIGRLCLRCGVCCFMLSARCTSEEAAQIEEEHGISIDRLTTIDEVGPNAGKRVLRAPCKLLQGKPLDHAFCKAYKGFRPEVCHTYICTIAQRYSLGMVSYHEALFWLRTAMITNNVTLFNWSSSKEHEDKDDRLILAGMVGTFADSLRDMGASQDHINLAVAERVTPKYFFRSPQDRLAVEMHFATFDRGDIDPKLFVDKDKIDSWDPVVRQFAIEIIRSVLEEIRSYFDKEDSPLTGMIQRIQSDESKKIMPVTEEMMESLKELDPEKFGVFDLMDWMESVIPQGDMPSIEEVRTLSDSEMDEVAKWCDKRMLGDKKEPASVPECLKRILRRSCTS